MHCNEFASLESPFVLYGVFTFAYDVRGLSYGVWGKF